MTATSALQNLPENREIWRRFLATVVPWDGAAFVNIHYKTTKMYHGKPVWRGAPCLDLDQAISQLDYILKRPDALDIFMCMSSQRECETKTSAKTGKPFKIAKRERENAVSLKSLFLDIDVKPGAYPTQKDATLALAKFIRATGLPKPTAVVESGSGGMHVHWTLHEALSVEKWQLLADALSNATKEHGLLCDTQCTVDAARILRVPGTFNYKKEPKAPVKLAMLRDVPCVLETVERALAPWISATPSHNVVPFRANDNDELSAGIGLGAALRNIADLERECPWVAHSIATGGTDNDDALRRRAFTIAVACEDSDNVAWSLMGNRSTLKDGEFEEQLARAKADKEAGKAPWPGCASIRACGAAQCASCAHLGKGKTPLHFALPVASAGSAGLVPAGALAAQITGPMRGTGTFQLAFNTLLKAPRRFTYDAFHDRLLLDDEQMTDAACRSLREFVINASAEGKDPGKDHVFEAASHLCELGRFDPVVDYLDSLAWDGVKRVNTWLRDYCGAKDTLYSRVIGRKFLLAMVRRAKQPGCKFDTALILESPQGAGKSTLAAILAGSADNFLDHDPTHLSAKEQQEQLRGRWLIELGELSGMKKAEVHAVKAFMSRTHDRGRPAWGRCVVDQPRRCVFIGTTNDTSYLRDDTGNRRFWPIKIGAVDLEALRKDRDQLFAEAVAIEKTGESLVLPQRLWVVAADEQEARRVRDPWEDILETVEGDPFCHKGANMRFASSGAILGSTLQIPPERQRGEAAKRVREIMERLGWTCEVVKRKGSSVRGYVRPA